MLKVSRCPRERGHAVVAILVLVGVVLGAAVAVRLAGSEVSGKLECQGQTLRSLGSGGGACSASPTGASSAPARSPAPSGPSGEEPGWAARYLVEGAREARQRLEEDGRPWGIQVAAAGDDVLQQLGTLAAALEVDTSLETIDRLDSLIDNEVEEGPLDLLRYGDSEVYIADYRTHAFMSWAMNRITAFVESSTAAGTVVPKGSIGPDRGWAGHDLRMEKVAAFINAANRDGGLTGEETALVRVLEANDLLRRTPGGLYEARANAVILGLTHGLDFGPDHESVLEGRGQDRERVGSHELQHGFHLTDPDYYRAVEAIYDDLRPQERDALERFLGGMGYDAENKELMMTELVAYAHTLGTYQWDQIVDRALSSGRITPDDHALLRGLGPTNESIWGDLPAPYDRLHDAVVKDVIGGPGGPPTARPVAIDSGRDDLSVVSTPEAFRRFQQHGWTFFQSEILRPDNPGLDLLGAQGEENRTVELFADPLSGDLLARTEDVHGRVHHYRFDPAAGSLAEETGSLLVTASPGALRRLARHGWHLERESLRGPDTSIELGGDGTDGGDNDLVQIYPDWLDPDAVILRVIETDGESPFYRFDPGTNELTPL